VIEWISACELVGPPVTLDVEDGERCTAAIPSTTIEVEFIVETYERLIIVRSSSDV
jgi:hypothetical protein